MSKRQKAVIWITVLLLVLTIITALFINYGYKITYPLKYTDIIKNYGSEYNVDVYLILSIIKAESNFYIYAKSSKGACGLMQLLPETAEWLCGNYGIEYNYDKLFEADYNIKLGVIYLKYLTEKFSIAQYDGYSVAISAYNAGEGTVNKWLNEDKLISYKDFPYSETVNFTDKVLKNMANYKKLYYLY